LGLLHCEDRCLIQDPTDGLAAWMIGLVCPMTPLAKRQPLQALYPFYRSAPALQKGKLLDAFVAATGYNRSQKAILAAITSVRDRFPLAFLLLGMTPTTASSTPHCSSTASGSTASHAQGNSGG